MKTIFYILAIIILASIAWSQPESREIQISDLQIVKAYQNADGKYIVSAIRRMSEMPLNDTKVVFATYGLYYGDKEFLHELKTEVISGNVMHDIFETKFFAYKAIANPTSIKATSADLTVSHTFQNETFTDKYQRLSSSALTKLVSELQDAKTDLVLFPDLSTVREVTHWFQSIDGSVEVKMQKSLVDKSEYLYVKGLEPSRLIKANMGVVEAANGYKISFVRGLDGKYKDIRLVKPDGSYVSLVANLIPEGRVMLNSVVALLPIPKIITPLDQFFGENGGTRNLERSEVSHMSPNPNINGTAKRCKSLLNPLTWFK